jgi:hypothetical protein
MRLVGTALALVLGGCSLLSMERLASPYRPQETPRCQDNGAPVLLDALAAFGYLVLMGSSVSSKDGTATKSVAYGVLAAVHATSGVWGLHEDHRCTRAHHAHDAWLRER